MEEDCPVYSWTPGGMVKWNHMSIGYIRKTDLDKLIGLAYSRGKRDGVTEAIKVVKDTTP